MRCSRFANVWSAYQFDLLTTNPDCRLSPMSEQFCSRCLYSTSHPLGLTLDAHDVCSGCRVHEEKNTLDWTTRWQRLEAIVQPYRQKPGHSYDCIVPVSGGHDSYYIVHLVKSRLGL